MRILVTGGGGLIGRHVVDRLVASGNDVVSYERDAGDVEPGLRTAATTVRGDLADSAQVNAVLADGIEGVIHLAAVPAPVGHTAVDLVRANTVTTTTVLEAAGTAGVTNVVLASSISVLGMAWADELMSPVSVPIDESHPLWPTEGYALSKEHDEATARMAARRWGMTVACLRFPFTTTQDALQARLHGGTPDELAAEMAKELWAYLDVRDAAEACELALLAAVQGRWEGAVVRRRRRGSGWAGACRWG